MRRRLACWVERWTTVAVVRVRTWRGHGDAHVSVPPPGGGSLGDQAIVQAFLDAVSRPVTVVAAADDHGVDGRSSGAQVVVEPNLLYGPFRHYLGAVWRLSGLLGRADSLTVFGTDVMDGRYDWRASTRRFHLVDAAARSRLDARVLGFSWNAAPDPMTLACLRRLSRRARLCVRDPDSARRVRAVARSEVVEVADLAFLVRPASGGHPGRPHEESPRPLMVVGPNALLADSGRHVDSLVAVAARAVADGWHVTLVPHDSRNDPNDLDLCHRIEGIVGSPHCRTRPPATVAEVVAVTSAAQVVVTGRMHLGILALGRGTPAVMLSYQGKVDGLMTFFGLEHLVVEPASNTLVEDLLAAVASVTTDELAAREAVRAGLDPVREMALLNVLGIRGTVDARSGSAT